MEAPEQRARMVERQLRKRGITDERVLAAMGSVPRECFVPEQTRGRAYADAALSIGHGQTISQPWIAAAICQALELEGTEVVLEVGGGSGYTAALLSRLAERVLSIEVVPELAARARETLNALGPPATGVEVITGDGSIGHPTGAPYDAIAVHAAAPGPPRTLLGQLRPGGRLVAPVDRGGSEMLTLFVAAEGTPGHYRLREISPCRFVPLIGAEGFPDG